LAIVDKFYLIDYQSIEAFFSNPPSPQKEVSSLPKQINRCSATVYLFYKAKQWDQAKKRNGVPLQRFFQQPCELQF